MIGQRAKIHRNNCLWWILIFAKAGTGSSPHFFETLSEKPEDIRNSQRAMALHHRVRTAASCLVRALNKSLVNTNPSFPCKEVSGSSRALLKKRQSLVQNPVKKSLEPCILWYVKYKFLKKKEIIRPWILEVVIFSMNWLILSFFLGLAWFHSPRKGRKWTRAGDIFQTVQLQLRRSWGQRTVFRN